MTRERLLPMAGFGALVALGAIVVALLWDGGGSGVPEPTVVSPSGIDAYADLDTYNVHFGDTVTARVEVTVDDPTTWTRPWTFAVTGKKDAS